MQVDAWYLFEPLAASPCSVTVEAADLTEECRAGLLPATDVLRVHVPIQSSCVQSRVLIVVTVCWRFVLGAVRCVVDRPLHELGECVDERLMLLAAIP